MAFPDILCSVLHRPFICLLPPLAPLQHIAFWDRDNDGVLWPQDTYVGFRWVQRRGRVPCRPCRHMRRMREEGRGCCAYQKGQIKCPRRLQRARETRVRFDGFSQQRGRVGKGVPTSIPLPAAAFRVPGSHASLASASRGRQQLPVCPPPPLPSSSKLGFNVLLSAIAVPVIHGTFSWWAAALPVKQACMGIA